MRVIKINPIVNDEGFTARSLTRSMEKSASTSSWTFFYHQPYKLDWYEARQKATERKWRNNDD